MHVMLPILTTPTTDTQQVMWPILTTPTTDTQQVMWPILTTLPYEQLTIAAHLKKLSQRLEDASFQHYKVVGDHDCEQCLVWGDSHIQGDGLHYTVTTAVWLTGKSELRKEPILMFPGF